MTENETPYGARLYAELLKLTGYSVVTRKLNSDAVQHLKQSNREQTKKLFSSCRYDLQQQISTKTPEEFARVLIEETQKADRNSTQLLAVLNNLNLNNLSGNS